MIPWSRDDGSPFGGAELAGAMERLADPGRERVAPRLPRPHIVSGRGNHRQRVARAAAAVVERGNRFPLPAAIAVGIGEHARPQERRKDRGRIEPLGRSIQGQRCRRFHDRDLPTVCQQQCGRGGAEVRQGDEHAAPVEQRDPGEVAARDRKHVLTRLPVDAAAPPVGFVETRTRGRPLFEGPGTGRPGLRFLRKRDRRSRPARARPGLSTSISGGSAGIGHPAVQHAPECAHR